MDDGYGGMKQWDFFVARDINDSTIYLYLLNRDFKFDFLDSDIYLIF
jgi:hypothetical protein